MTVLRLLALGLATAIRPTSLAAVGALAAAATPRRFLTAYVIAGLAFTIAIGAAVIWLIHGVDITTRSGPFRGVAQIGGGLATITFGLVLLSGRRTRTRPVVDQPASASRWTTALSEHISVRRAALAGPVTHLPGLLYLVALNVIITEPQSARESLVQLLVYNGGWFAVPIAVLTLSIIRPGTASRVITVVQPWARKHGRSVLAVVCLALGIALVVHGVVIR